jgi:hypothetical protein
MNNFEHYLLEFKESVNNFKGKKKMSSYIEEILDKSCNLYCKTLQELCNFTLNQKPYKSLKTFNKIIGGK